MLVENRLFATLDTRSRSLDVGWAGYGGREVVITDTVGFIRDLPKDLFTAFRSTFEEAADADLLIHVVDAGDPARDEQVDTTLELLDELELSEIPRILVYNKSDLLPPGEVKRLARMYPEIVFVSATERETTRPLLAAIAEELADRWDKSARVPALNATTPP